jgi:hypothetical protein
LRKILLRLRIRQQLGYVLKLAFEIWVGTFLDERVHQRFIGETEWTGYEVYLVYADEGADETTYDEPVCSAFQQGAARRHSWGR